ncbi:hypothetical protein FH972_024970 [Carpinus fangiana]|uniref:Uncharacterized protein n=1 Tax=Carpinus fangiana TaxID=176857 RepID=A0A5N6L002_9ROSI|nr:hypothetical protein FH972_024970 [Carpinus fangiana]
MKFEEMMKNLAYLTQATKKKKSSLETKQGEPVIMEANAGDRVHMQEHRPDHAKNKGVRIEEGDIPGSSVAEDCYRRAVFNQQTPYVDSRKQRRPWTSGHHDPFFCEERQDQRYPKFNM